MFFYFHRGICFWEKSKRQSRSCLLRRISTDWCGLFAGWMCSTSSTTSEKRRRPVPFSFSCAKMWYAWRRPVSRSAERTDRSPLVWRNFLEVRLDLKYPTCHCLNRPLNQSTKFFPVCCFFCGRLVTFRCRSVHGKGFQCHRCELCDAFGGNFAWPLGHAEGNSSSGLRRPHTTGLLPVSKGLSGRLIDWLAFRFNDRSFAWLIDWSTVLLIHRLIDWLIDWLIGRSIQWSLLPSIDWLIDWFEFGKETVLSPHVCRLFVALTPKLYSVSCLWHRYSCWERKKFQKKFYIGLEDLNIFVESPKTWTISIFSNFLLKHDGCVKKFPAHLTGIGRNRKSFPVFSKTENIFTEKKFEEKNLVADITVVWIGLRKKVEKLFFTTIFEIGKKRIEQRE